MEILTKYFPGDNNLLHLIIMLEKAVENNELKGKTGGKLKWK